MTGLRQEDFALFEDAVRQKIGAFVEVSQPERNAGRGTNMSVSEPQERLIAQAQNPGVAGPRFLAIVFDRLSSEARGSRLQGRAGEPRHAT